MQRTRGFGIVSSLVLLVMLAMMGTFMINLSSLLQQSGLNSAQRSHALRAAKTGIEYGAYQAITTTNTTQLCVSASQIALATLNTLGNDLSHFSVAVSCSASRHTEVGIATPYYVYAITSVATFGSFGDINYVTRRLEAKFTSDNIF